MKRNKLFSNKFGFTLIELLVVIAIIGVLTAIVGGGFRTSQAKSRDAQRKSDLKQISNALEIYYNDYGKYPDSLPWGAEFSDTKTVYFKEVPTDPSSSLEYNYTLVDSPSNQKYQLFAYLENSQDRAIDPLVIEDNRDCGNQECNFGISSSNTTPSE